MANETTKRLIARVKQLRLARGLTQEQFAELTDLDPKYYQHVEAGRKPNPGMETLLNLAKGTGFELWQLLNFDAEPLISTEDQATYGSKNLSPKAHSSAAPPQKVPELQSRVALHLRCADTSKFEALDPRLSAPSP